MNIGCTGNYRKEEYCIILEKIHKILKNKLSWEREKIIHPCNNNNCLKFGEYKAPQSRLKLNEY